MGGKALDDWPRSSGDLLPRRSRLGAPHFENPQPDIREADSRNRSPDEIVAGERSKPEIMPREEV